MVQVRYGRDSLDVDIPQENLAFDLRIKNIPRTGGDHEEIKRSLANPVGSKRLRDSVPKDASVVILGDDRTRMTPQHLIVPEVLKELYAAGVKNERIKLLIAYGTHRPMSAEEIADKYGSDIVSDIEILHHNCLDKNNLVDRGITRRGTRIFVNRDCMEADFRIGIGSVIPHYPTGWSGGAKILLPGVAGEETTCAMHLLGVSEKALGQVLSPVRGEMEDFAREVGLHFIVNIVHDGEGAIVRSVTGHYIEAHREAVSWGRKVYGASFREPADITLSSTYPVDFDLTQSSKGLFSAECATKPGGEIILLSPCHEGVAPTHGGEMLRLAQYDNDTLMTMLEQKQVSNPMAAAICMYYNIIKSNYKTTLTMDPVLGKTMGFHHMSHKDVSAYIKRRLEKDSALKIGIIHQSTEVLPIPSQTETQQEL